MNMFDPGTLDDIKTGTNIDKLDQTMLKNVQRSLSWMTYPISKVDGYIGPNTRSAFAEYMFDIGESDDDKITAKSKTTAIKRIDETQSVLQSDVSTKDKTKSAIAALCEKLGIGLKTQIAYVLATAQWETNHTFKPVKEAYWNSENWRKKNLHYYPYYGRGYVQLTWKSNYSNYYNIMREPLVANPDLALAPEISLMVLVHGFKLGKFTGRKITDYINKSKTDFKNARRCINGLDKWNEIKKLAEKYVGEL
jgi:predicted chitinase